MVTGQTTDKIAEHLSRLRPASLSHTSRRMYVRSRAAGNPSLADGGGSYSASEWPRGEGKVMLIRLTTVLGLVSRCHKITGLVVVTWRR